MVVQFVEEQDELAEGRLVVLADARVSPSDIIVKRVARRVIVACNCALRDNLINGAARTVHGRSRVSQVRGSEQGELGGRRSTCRGA